MKKALITDYVWPDIETESEVLRSAGVEPLAAPDATEETLAGLAASCASRHARPPGRTRNPSVRRRPRPSV